MKSFNVTGICYPEKHYMVDISERLCHIEKMVNAGNYFAINRGRQYGKTTTLSLLKKELEKNYVVFFISFEGLGEECFASTSKLANTFLRLLYDTIDYDETLYVDEETRQFIKESMEKESVDFLDLGNIISKLCKMLDKPVVLFVDEVDQASNYKSFIDFLGLLRDKYLKRNSRPTFQSVILASVYDIKNLRLRIRKEEEHQYNSPWNIAVEFNLRMDFSVEDISNMLFEYENECQTGMDVNMLSQMLYDYTAGYPFLVSRICMLIDERIKGDMAFIRRGQRKDLWKQSRCYCRNPIHYLMI